MRLEGDSGSVTVIDTDALAVVETVATERDAHTLAWDPVRETPLRVLPS